jgi:hypothetical protein
MPRPQQLRTAPRRPWPLLLLLALTPTAQQRRLACGGGAVADWRNISTGLPIWPPASLRATETYQDQPQVQVLADGTWFVVWTHGVGTSEGAPNIVLSARSTNRGRSWSAPVDVEPLAGNYSKAQPSSSASWANPLLIGSRLYVFYTYNCWNTGLGGNAGVIANLSHDAGGSDANLLGCWYYKVSTDGGRSFPSARHNYTAAVAADMRFTIDRENAFQTGTCKDQPCPRGVIEGWSTGKPLLASNGDVFMQFTKIGGAGNAESQSFFLRSRNLLPATEPSAVKFELLPKAGATGLKAICGHVSQEGNLIEMAAMAGRYYAVARSLCGYITAWQTADHGETWTPPGYAEYDRSGAQPPAIYGKGLRHPDGPLCPRHLELAGGVERRYLMLYYNTGWQDDTNPADSKGRTTYWLTAGRVINVSTVVWSQPEIVFYSLHTGVSRSVDYPDFIQQDGELYVSETDKHTTRTNHVPREFWAQLLQQSEVSHVVRDGSLIAEWNSSSAGRVVSLADSAWGEPIAGECKILWKPCSSGNASFTIEVSGQLLPAQPASNVSWLNVTRNKAPKDSVGAIEGTSPGLCYTGNLTLEQCRANCTANPSCIAFWRYDYGRCCPKQSYSLQRGWQDFKIGGGWYTSTRELEAPLLDCRDSIGSGVAIFAAAAGVKARPVLALSSDNAASQQASGDSEPWNADGRNSIAVVVDGAAQIVSFVTNGVLAEGGALHKQGWTALSQELGSVAGARRCKVAGGVENVRVYSRALMTTELVGMWRAGASQDVLYA